MDSETYPDEDNVAIARSVMSANFARQLVLRRFLDQVQSWPELGSRSGPLRVAVVGGSADEPELLALAELGVPLEVRTFGVEGNDVYLDLNSPVPDAWSANFSADLVLCSQVIEHVWHHENAFSWLGELSGHQTRLWLAVPASNRPHGSPDYFSAGFTDGYLVENLRIRGWHVLDSGMLGSRRLYVAALTSNLWLSERGHEFPMAELLGAGNGRNFLSGIRRNGIDMFRLSFASKRVRTDLRYATEAWLWLERCSRLKCEYVHLG